ncbi:MAG: hypothetical protein R2735_12250 [Microthrixaceae bacterium]
MDSRNEPVKAGFERSLRQRNALLKQVRGRLDTSASATLDVWDHQLADSGERLSVLRQGLIDDLTPLVTKAYRDIAGYEAEVVLHYASSWRERGLKESLVTSREDDLRRGVTLVGPHRDDVTISLGDMPARTHASQGEQRTLALALRVAGTGFWPGSTVRRRYFSSMTCSPNSTTTERKHFWLPCPMVRGSSPLQPSHRPPFTRISF